MKHMTYGEFPPSPILAPFVECFWAVSFKQSPFQPIEILVPDGRTEIIFNYGSAYKRFIDHNRKRYEFISGSHYVGMREKSIFLEEMDGISFFAIRFRPGGILSFLRIPAFEFVQQFLPLETLWGKVAGELEARIFEAPNYAEKVKAAESVLLRQLKKAYTEKTFLDAALQDIYARKGHCTIDEIKEKYKVGYKKLERHFLKKVGCTPKLYIKMVRLSRAIDMMQRQPETSMTEVAYETGFYDQAHFNRDFKLFTGNTPRQFKKKRYTISRVIKPKLHYQPAACIQV